MRTAYLALNGYVVDVFSAKNSLSSRDHDEFAPVLDAMGIKHAYITDKTLAKHYQSKNNEFDDNEIGGVNYATIGDLDLFLSTHAWEGETAINLTPTKRVAFIDEADHVLLDEQTQFNYSASDEVGEVYNLDEWVYRVAYDFYLANKDKFKVNEFGITMISRSRDLKVLCEHLQQQVRFAPKQSTFFDKYIIPALDEKNAEAIEKRDQKLVQLLTASHIANGLQEDVNFCKRPATQIVSNGMMINTRFAKVMIANQVKDGSTYSDLVQQFLHVRLNKEAVEKGEAPDYFVEPVMRIALSLNAPYVLKNLYGKLEGCTGTAGGKTESNHYETVYGIDHVVKMPTHEVRRTKILPSVFCESENHQIKVLVEQILNHSDRPMLITCADDIAVKRIAKKLREELIKYKFNLDNFIVDTNDSGKPESAIVPLAGRVGAVTVSSRMGRGTDIKPETKAGLMVIRTYPSSPHVEKQERGRQGRNGAEGSCQDIINYTDVHKQYEAIMKDSKKTGLAKRLAEIFSEQQQHLEEKLLKHQADDSNKSDWLIENKIPYLSTCSLAQFKHELKEKYEHSLRKKEALLATLSGNVLNVLYGFIVSKKEYEHKTLKTAWLETNRKIEALWNSRLAGKEIDSEEVYLEFFKQADDCWQSLCSRFHALDSLALLKVADSVTQLSKGEDAVSIFIQKNLEIWQAKLNKNNVRKEDFETLQALRQKLRKEILLKCHPDKCPNGEELTKKATDLLKVVNESIQKIEVVVEDKNNIVIEPLSSMNLDKHVSKGAIVISDAIPQKVAKRIGGADILSFYQEWMKSVEAYYFGNKKTNFNLLVAFYGLELQGLNSLFSQLQIAGYYNTESEFIQEEQDQRRIHLFAVLSDLMPTQRLNFISCKTWGEVINHVLNQNVGQTQHYLGALQAFFSQESLFAKSSQELTPDDIEKRDRLLKLVMDIVDTTYVQENDVSPEFIKRLGRVILEKFSASFDKSLVVAIKDLFAKNPEVTKLLMSQTNDSDLIHLLELLLVDKKSKYSESRQTTDGIYQVSS